MTSNSSRSMAAPDPAEVKRRRRGRTQRSLAAAVTDSLSRPDFQPAAEISARTIQRIERGEEVYRHMLLPVLIYLGLMDPPLLTGPKGGQHPGAWVRELRDGHG